MGLRAREYVLRSVLKFFRKPEGFFNFKGLFSHKFQFKSKCKSVWLKLY